MGLQVLARHLLHNLLETPRQDGSWATAIQRAQGVSGFELIGKPIRRGSIQLEALGRDLTKVGIIVGTINYLSTS